MGEGFNFYDTFDKVIFLRYLKDGGACQHWPTGRGIYLNKNKNFLVWVGEEDHLRIISMQQGGNLGEVFSRLILKYCY